MKKRKSGYLPCEDIKANTVQAPCEPAPVIVGYFDGCCEPTNPGGNMGIGATLRCGGEEIFRHSKFVPKDWDNSNNVAEYMAFESILDFLEAGNFQERQVHICGDSKLVIMQMLGLWRIKFGRYVPWADRCMKKLTVLKERKLSFTLEWIPRGQNWYADELSKAELLKNNVEMRIQPLEPGEKEKIILAAWKEGKDGPVKIIPSFIHARYKD